MDQTLIRQMLLEDLVTRYIHKVQFDPKRSLRKLADLGEHLSQGHILRPFFDTAQHLLEREDSPYYVWAQRVSAWMDPGALKTLGVNIVLNGWNRLKKEGNRALPWALLFRLSNVPDALKGEELERAFQEGASMGIRTFFLCPDSTYSALDGLIRRTRAFSECSFGLFTPASLLTGPVLDQLGQSSNLLLSIQEAGAASDALQTAYQALRERRCPFALHTVYQSPEDAERILSGRWFGQVSRFSPFAFCLPGRGCPPETREAVRKYIKSVRLSPRYPALAMELYADIVSVGRVLSGFARFVDVQPDGTLTQYDERQDVFRQGSLRRTARTHLLA